MTNDYRALCAELVAIEDALSGGSIQFSNQGQALDGYSALATFRDVADRARALLAQPVAEGPTDEELLESAAKALGYKSIPSDETCLTAEAGELLDYARAVLAKWGANAQ